MTTSGILTTRLLLTTAVIIPTLTAGIWLRREAGLPDITSAEDPAPLPTETFECAESLLEEFEEWRPRITNVNIVDLDSDGLNDIIVCDAVRQAVWWCRQTAAGQFQRRRITPETGIAAPCHSAVVDIDRDGDPDIVVAVLRSIWPTDRRVGQVVLLENTGDFVFEARVLIDHVRRITDVQPADLDQDGDIDLAVAEFGYLHGGVFWLENDGQQRFTEHELLSRSGAIHVPLRDYDNDGDIDIAAVVSQDMEEVWIFDNDGAAGFTKKRIWGTVNFDLGLAGMIAEDLDQDGDQDLILAAGDNFEYVFPAPQPYHGCRWLENRGSFEFVHHDLGYVPGCYACATADIDSDGDLDVIAGSMFHDDSQPAASRLTLLQNDGQQNFEAVSINSGATRISTIDCGDLNADGRPDIVLGTLQTFAPFDKSPAVSILIPAKESP